MATKKAGPGGPARKRGRPKKAKRIFPLSALSIHSPRGTAFDLFLAEAELRSQPRRLQARERGRPKSIAGIAREQEAEFYRNGDEPTSTTIERLKKYARCHADLRPVAYALFQNRLNDLEFKRRVLGLPPDVRQWLLGQASGGWVLEFLRRANIDRHCPRWLSDAAKRDDWEPLIDVMGGRLSI